jgi:hypothetical protein
LRRNFFFAHLCEFASQLSKQFDSVPLSFARVDFQFPTTNGQLPPLPGSMAGRLDGFYVDPDML